jgi:hypothetical protein
MSGETQPAGRRVRDQLILDTVNAFLERMNEDGLTPPEGLIVAELVLWQLCDNLMKLAPTERVEDMRLMALRKIVRLESRIKAWPARVEDRT